VNTAEVDTAHTLYASTPSDRTDLRLDSQHTYRFFEFVAQRAGCERPILLPPKRSLFDMASSSPGDADG